MSRTVTYGHALRHDPTMLRQALEGAKPTPFWLDDPARPVPRAALRGHVEADLVVVGGGYAGLWTALRAKERHPEWQVVLLEGERVGGAASGRNGGFVEASLTHGSENGELHFAEEMPELERLASENFRALADDITRYGIDAEFEREPTLTVATEPHHVSALAQGSTVARSDANGGRDGFFLRLASLFGVGFDS